MKRMTNRSIYRQDDERGIIVYEERERWWGLYGTTYEHRFEHEAEWRAWIAEQLVWLAPFSKQPHHLPKSTMSVFRRYIADARTGRSLAGSRVRFVSNQAKESIRRIGNQYEWVCELPFCREGEDDAFVTITIQLHFEQHPEALTERLKEGFARLYRLYLSGSHATDVDRQSVQAVEMALRS